MNDDHQPAPAAHLGALQVGVEVLPPDAVVLLVQADGVLDRVRLPLAVGELDVEVPDLAQAVTAQLQRVRQDADAVLADVEGVAPALEGPGVAVGDEELGHGGPVDDRAQPAVVGVTDGVQHQALARVEAEPETPVLPAHLPAVDLEADPVRLRDLDGLQAAARGGDAGRVVAGAGRQRHHAEVFHPDHRHVVDIDDRVQPVDRLGVRVVARAGPVEAEGPDQAPALVLLPAEGPDAPRLHQHLVRPVDAPALEGRPGSGDRPGPAARIPRTRRA